MPATVWEGRHRSCIAEPLKCICVVVRNGMEWMRKKRDERNEGRWGVSLRERMKWRERWMWKNTRLYPQMMYVLTTDNTSGSNGSSSATVRKMWVRQDSDGRSGVVGRGSRMWVVDGERSRWWEKSMVMVGEGGETPVGWCVGATWWVVRKVREVWGERNEERDEGKRRGAERGRRGDGV